MRFIKPSELFIILKAFLLNTARMKIKKKRFLLLICLFPLLAFPQTTSVIKVTHKPHKLPFGLTSEQVERPTLALALSGGGARGLAQIGVLKALLEAGIKPQIIVGTSMGSLVGGLYAAGYSIKQLDSIAVNTNWASLLAFENQSNRRDLFVDQKVTEDKAVFTLRLKGLKPVLPTSLNGGLKIMNFLNLVSLQAPIHVHKDFDDLRSKFRAVCTNLVTGEPVVLQKGSLSQAMRASSSVSFFLSPVDVDSLVLVDGGLVANIPVDIAKNQGADYVIAVNTTSDLHKKNALEYPWIVADQVVSIPMKILNEDQLKDADVVITPNINNHDATNFENIDSLIDIGYKSTISKIAGIKNALDSLSSPRSPKTWFKNVFLSDDIPAAAKEYVEKYSMMDSVSNTEILRDMEKIYSGGSYKNVSAEISHDGRHTNIHYVLEDNPVLGEILFNNTTEITAEEINSIFSDIMGKPYNADKAGEKLISLINKYRSLGNSLAEITNAKFDPKTGALEIHINEGRLQGLIIEGNEKTNTEVIAREFPFSENSFFSYSKIEEGLTNLRSTNLFDDIILNLKKIGGKDYLAVKVREKVSSLLRFGFRVDNEYKAQISLDLRDENIFGSGSELGLLLFSGTRNGSYILEHKANRVFDSYLTYNINAFYNFRDIYSYKDDPETSDTRFSRSENGEYRQKNYGLSVSVGTQVEKFGNLIFNGKYEIDEVRNLSGTPASTYKIKLATFKVSSTIDTQDKYPFPNKGLYFSAFYETGQTIFGGDIGFQKIGFAYKNYITVGKHNTFSPRIELGFGDKTLPLSQQYALGGQESFFGMHDYEYRGRQLFLASFEYRYLLPVNIFFTTYFKIRYDLGSTWEFPEQIRFKDLRHGIGASLAFDTPIGPAEFSVGRSFKFKKNLPDNPISWGDVLFYFSIGYKF